MDIISFLDILFIGKCPRSDEGWALPHDSLEFELFSFVKGSGVEAFIKPTISGLFNVDDHGERGCIVSFIYKGVRGSVAGCYMHPQCGKAQWLEFGFFLRQADMAIGDFNCKHMRWASLGENLNGRQYRGEWLCYIVDQKG